MGGKGSLTVARIRGIPVRLHFTFLLILPYLAYVIGRTTPTLARMAGVDAAELWLPPYALGLLLGVGLFLCVLVHEFAHVFVGLRGGAKVQGVTLMIVGGVSEITEFPKRPSFEAAMAAAGPLASFGLGLLALLGYLLSGAAAPDLRFSLHYLSFMNFALAIFNLIPAFPMDGGRILRAVLAMVTNRVRATRIASWVGQGLALLFFAGGLFSFNWVLVLIGMLVVAGARAEFEMVKSSSLLEGMSVEQAMLRFPPTVEVGDSLGWVLARMEHEVKTTYFVVSRGEYVGALTAEDARRAEASGDMATAGDAVRRDLPVLRPDQDLASVAQALRNSGATILPVVKDGLLVGSVSTASLMAAIRALDEQKTVAAARREREAT